jgi:hypothetical protein
MGRGFLRAVSRLIGAIALVVLGYYALSGIGGVEVPEAPRINPADRVALNHQQGWPDGWGVGQAQWFHHTSQGTRILPLDWFMNLQQPSLNPQAPLIVEGDYLQRFGFLPSSAHERLNPGKPGSYPNGLPIGFAVAWDFKAPYADPPSTGPVVGLTCAACHTGQILVRDQGDRRRLHSARIEGGSAMISISAFQDAMGLALGYTVKIPTRLDRFLRKVLGEKYDDSAQRKRLKDELNAFLDSGMKAKSYAETHHLTGTVGGFARTDALSLIGNRVFVALGNENLIVPDAPVNFPPLWDTAWFDWVQYDGSIRMPMVRNIGEALGVGAPVNLLENQSKAFDSAVDVKGLHLMEAQLGGTTSLSGLQPPRWADLVEAKMLPPLEDELVKRGKPLYKDYCQRCHLPPMDQLRAFAQGKSNDDASRAELEKFFEVDAGGATRRILKLTLVDLQEIGTDPNQALNFYRRVAVFRGQTISAAVGLYTVTELIRRDKFRGLGIISPDDPRNLEYNRYRAFNPVEGPGADLDTKAADKLLKGDGMCRVLAANLKYRARPLDGLWATPPFLHNGSVPSLRQLLSPVVRRDKKFYLGTTVFDPKDVGYETHSFSGAFRLDTTQPGNSNVGHEFRDLTLEELESVPEVHGHASTACPTGVVGNGAVRWAHVLGITRQEYLGLAEENRRNLVRKATWQAFKVERVQHEHPFRGVLGAELTDDERDALIEYIKSL